MNHKQISNLKFKIDSWFELLEDYYYYCDFGAQTIPKGTKIKLLYPFLGGWRFEFEKSQEGIFTHQVGLGRSRLLKMKLKEIIVSPKGREK